MLLETWKCQKEIQCLTHTEYWISKPIKPARVKTVSLTNAVRMFHENLIYFLYLGVVIILLMQDKAFHIKAGKYEWQINLYSVRSPILLHQSDCKFVYFNCTNITDSLTPAALIFHSFQEHRSICLVLLPPHWRYWRYYIFKNIISAEIQNAKILGEARPNI